MAFNAGQILVFDRAGQRLGILTKPSIVAPRSYAFTDTEDFAFYIPQKDETGTTVLDAAALALLAEDNLIYIENELVGLPGWAGAIDQVELSDERATVRCLGGTSLLSALQCDRIIQTGGSSATVAARLVAAANAKKGPHGDLVLGFVADESPPLYGSYDFTGDILQGVQSLASDTLAEFYSTPTLGPGGMTLAIDIHWAKRLTIDHTDIVIENDTDGALIGGGKYVYSGLEVLNHIVLHGVPTHLSDFLDYDCISSVVKDITPQIEITLDREGSPARYREDETLSVNFGLSDDFQRQIAQSGWDDPATGEFRPGIQPTYLGYYKSFLYAYHHRQGKPFLEGFDWGGPDGSNDKVLTERLYRTWNHLAHAATTHVVTTETDGNLPNASIEDWEFEQTVAAITTASSVALDWGTTTDHWVTDKATGNLLTLDSDNVTADIWSGIAAPGTLLAVATDPGAIDELWTLTGNTIRSYDIDSRELLLQYDINPAFNANDIAVDNANARLYVVGPGSSRVEILDLNSGLPIVPDPSFESGFAAPTGLSISGGVAYVSDAAGNVRMLFIEDEGSFAGSFATGIPTEGIYADFTNRRVWVIGADGTLNVFHAYVALGTVQQAGGVTGAPGFDEIVKGSFLHVVMHSNPVQGPSTKPSPGSSVNYTVRGPIGSDHDSLWKIAVKFYKNGSLWRTIYAANKAVIGPNPSLIYPGQVFRIPNVKHTPPVPTTTTKYLHVHTPGRWEQNIIPGPIGQPDQVIREWTQTGDQVVAISRQALVHMDSPDIVIEGEEGRVCDWNPTLDGYGLLKEEQLYRTKAGHRILAGHGWYPHDWDVPETAFQPPSDPPWPEGELYARDYLATKNRRVTVQQFKFTNKDGLWSKIERGGVYTVIDHFQGEPGVGITLQVRILKFSPNELTGEMEAIGEEL